MTSTKAKFTKQEKAKARNLLECYHEGLDLEDKLRRKEIYIHIFTMIVTSPWWLATREEYRASIVDHLVMSNEKDDALDVMYS